MFLKPNNYNYEKIEMDNINDENDNPENNNSNNNLEGSNIEINIYNKNEENEIEIVDDKNKKANNNVIKSKRERLYWIDALRIVASYMVIFIHCSDMDHVKKMEFFSAEWKSYYFYYCILKPCVPLFIMISGLLFLDPNKNVTLDSLFKRSIPRLLKGYFFWSTYYSFIDKLVVNKDNKTFNYDMGFFNSIYEDIVLARTANQLWYVKFCIGLYMFTPIFREIIPKNKLTWYTLGVSCISQQILPTIFEFFRIFTPIGIYTDKFKTFIDNLRLYPFNGCITYLILGYLLNVNTLTNQKYIGYFYLVGILGFILTPVLMFSSCYVNGKYGRSFGDYMNFNVCMETVGIFMFFKYTINKYLKELVKHNKFKKILIILSDCSFGIYLIHLHIYHILIKIKFHAHALGFPILFIPFYSLIIFSISFVCVFLMRKVRILKTFT